MFRQADGGEIRNQDPPVAASTLGLAAPAKTSNIIPAMVRYLGGRLDILDQPRPGSSVYRR